MARNQNRRGLLEALGFAGVTEISRGPKVSDDIQLVYMVSDISRALPALRQPQFVHTSFSGTNAARRGITELSPPPDSAIVIPWFRNDDAVNGSAFSVSLTPRITNDIFTRIPSLQISGPSRSLLQDGTTSIGGGQIVLGPLAEVPANFPALVVPPGSFWSLTTAGVNQASFISVAWFEVPLAAQTTP